MPASPARKIGTAVKVLPSCTRSSVFQVPETGIGAEEVPAEAQFTRPFVSEITILQRERSPDIPQSLWLIGCL
ncbi:hypothetical protein C6A85_04030, partial [Mycobacterium sp. ITM-2017-0098]